jgi:uncharacterized Ntn-hydrolase superfamily protein
MKAFLGRYPRVSRNRRAFFTITVPVLWIAAALPAWAVGGTFDVGTFSIVAYDGETREWGVAVASRVLAVGYIVPWAKAGVGAVATQAYANLDYGIEGLSLLENGLAAGEVIERLREEDPEPGRRQVAVVDAAGDAAAFTGEDTLPWSGHIAGDGYSVQGNILAGEEVLKEMERAYLDSPGPLARRLVEALKAGEAAGGDKRGKESAALLVVRAGGGYQGKTDRFVDVRVDDHAEPVAELERIYGLWEERFLVYKYLESGGEREAAYALAIMDRALAEGPEDAAVYNDFAWALATKKLYPQRALEMALRAQELAPEDANVMDTLAEAYYAAAKNDEAVAWEKKALARDPGNEFFAEQLKKFEEAAAKFEEVQK